MKRFSLPISSALVAVSAAVTQDTRPVKDSFALEECYSQCTPSHVSMAALLHCLHATHFSIGQAYTTSYLRSPLSLAFLIRSPIILFITGMYWIHSFTCIHVTGDTAVIQWHTLIAWSMEMVSSPRTHGWGHIVHTRNRSRGLKESRHEAAMPSAKCVYNVLCSSLVTLTIQILHCT